VAKALHASISLGPRISLDSSVPQGRQYH
jgi:hypothetical protein